MKQRQMRKQVQQRQQSMQETAPRGNAQQSLNVNQQSASEASASTTRRNRSTGARGDSTHQRYNSGVAKDDMRRENEGARTRTDKQIR